MANTKRLGALLTVAAAALVAVGLVVLMLVVVEARPAEASFPGKNGKIAHAADDGGIYRIYTINPKGGATFRVTHTNTFTATPDYSPNGKRIAYSNIQRGSKTLTQV